MTKVITSKLVAAATLASVMAVPTFSSAQGWRQRASDHRQSTKNTWRNLGIAGGVAGVAGLLTHNNTLTALGLGGGLYSTYRYEQDRKSQNRLEHDRYNLFRNRNFDYGGHHYERRERWRNGQRHYYFYRSH